MTEYIIYFNQQWVGDHSDEWFIRRGQLAKAVVEEMKNAGVYVFAGGLEEDIDKPSAPTRRAARSRSLTGHSSRPRSSSAG